jgi:nucleoside-diphosphate-sugar epimerase
MKKVLITGSQGYLGSVLTQYLTENGFHCKGLDVGFFKNELLYDPRSNVTLFRDARDLTENDLEKIDVVLHLAGISNDPMGKLDASRIYDPTREYAIEIAKKCKKLGVRFIFASSCSIYGLGQDKLLTEDSEVYPQTGYSKNKLEVEEGLINISDKDFSPIALRFATVFGHSPRIRFDLVINMLTGMAMANKQIILNSDGKAWRPNLHIQDLCKAVKCAINYDYKGRELMVLNVGSDENNLQIIDIAKIIQRSISGCELKFLSENPELDKEGLIKDRKIKDGGGDTRTYKVSFDKISKALPGFEKCDWSVEKGVIDMAAKFEEVGFNKNIFKKTGFYRLQQLEFLYENGYISDDLRWLKRQN